MSDVIYQEFGEHLIRKTVMDAGWKVELYAKVQNCGSVAEAIAIAKGETVTPHLESMPATATESSGENLSDPLPPTSPGE